MNKSPSLSRVGTLAGLAITLASLSSCNSDNSPNLPPIIPTPNSVVVADINGAPDLLVATTADEGMGLNPGYADVILNTPGSPGTFQTGVHYSTTGSNPSSIAVADLTGTGGVDMVIANFGNGSVSVFLHGADGTFNQATDVPTGGQPNQVVSCDPHAKAPLTCDLTGNGKPSFVLADMSGNVIVLLAQPSGAPGTFEAPITLATGLTTPSVWVGNLKGDGVPDIVAAVFDSSGNNGAVLVFSQDRSNRGHFSAPVSFPAGAQPQSVKVADVNGDGLPDIVVANYGPGNDGTGMAGVSVLLQTATAATAPAAFGAPVTYATAGASIDVAVADLNGDGKPDIVVANLAPESTGSVSVLLQTTGGAYGPATNYPALGQPLGVAIADLNGDNHPDIAIADGPSAGVLLQNPSGNGTFGAVMTVGWQ